MLPDYPPEAIRNADQIIDDLDARARAHIEALLAAPGVRENIVRGAEALIAQGIQRLKGALRDDPRNTSRQEERRAYPKIISVDIRRSARAGRERRLVTIRDARDAAAMLRSFAANCDPESVRSAAWAAGLRWHRGRARRGAQELAQRGLIEKKYVAIGIKSYWRITNAGLDVVMAERRTGIDVAESIYLGGAAT